MRVDGPWAEHEGTEKGLEAQAYSTAFGFGIRGQKADGMMYSAEERDAQLMSRSFLLFIRKISTKSIISTSK